MTYAASGSELSLNRLIMRLSAANPSAAPAAAAAPAADHFGTSLRTNGVSPESHAFPTQPMQGQTFRGLRK
jgi:hypothetical protein